MLEKDCECLREHAMKIINFKKKNETINKRAAKIIWKFKTQFKNLNICKEKFENKYLKDKKYHNVRDYCHFAREYRGAANSLCN